MSLISHIENAIASALQDKSSAAPAAPSPVPVESALELAGPDDTDEVRAPSAASLAPAGVDIDAALDSLAARNPQALHWRTSISDLMTLVGIDPSYQNRKQLASELGYQGDTSNSVTMSIWLHKHLMKRLSKNGATVPLSLRH